MTTTVIIVTNGTRSAFLKEALASIDAQTVRPTELIVRYGTGLIGPFIELNKVMSRVTTDTFIVLADDDMLAPSFIEETLSVMETRRVDIVGTLLENFGAETGVHAPDSYPWATSLCKTKWWHTVGGFDESVGVAADMDFWLRCFDQGAKWTKIGKPLFLYRKHQGQLSNHCDWEFTHNKMVERFGGRDYHSSCI